MMEADAESRKPIIVVAGPTGAGKSALALDLARAFRGTIVNADSQQVYREINVLTQRPSAAEEACVPHRLFGVLPVSARCSAGRWLVLALAAIADIRREGRLPIVAGGTGLYLKALIEGIADIPTPPPEAVAEVRAVCVRLGGAAFRAELARLDPESAARIPPADTQRLVRAYAVVRATGTPLSEWHRRQRRRARVPPGRFLVLALNPPRAELGLKLDARFDAMMAQGALAEARALAALGLDSTLPALKAVGVRELLAHVRGETTLPEAVAKAKRATRQFAKRQETWLRHQIAAQHVFQAFGETVGAEACALVAKFLAGTD
jgi:tRNA dimethylallyltransferase